MQQAFCGETMQIPWFSSQFALDLTFVDDSYLILFFTVLVPKWSFSDSSIPFMSQPLTLFCNQEPCLSVWTHELLGFSVDKFITLPNYFDASVVLGLESRTLFFFF